jgi:hypothetical protein
VDACFGLFRHSATLTQERCTVCAEHSIGSEIILDAPDGSLRRHWSCGISFQSILETVVVSVQDRCTVCAKHRSEIVLDAPDGTPR